MCVPWGCNVVSACAVRVCVLGVQCSECLRRMCVCPGGGGQGRCVHGLRVPGAPGGSRRVGSNHVHSCWCHHQKLARPSWRVWHWPSSSCMSGWVAGKGMHELRERSAERRRGRCLSEAAFELHGCTDTEPQLLQCRHCVHARGDAWLRSLSMCNLRPPPSCVPKRIRGVSLAALLQQLQPLWHPACTLAPAPLPCMHMPSLCSSVCTPAPAPCCARNPGSSEAATRPLP